MSGKSSIQWTEATWNPVTGCTRVSAGCDHCYAFQLHDQRHIAWKRGHYPSAPAQYHEPFSHVQLLPERLGDPLKWRNPRRVFVDSMADLFHERVPDDYLCRVFAVLRKADRHSFQILTKRPERMRDWSRRYCSEPLPNVWLGTSVEDQTAANERIPHLVMTPAVVRFLSCEPLLAPLTIVNWPLPTPADWVIIGGESGSHARPMDLAWVRALVAECREAGAAVFVKQLGTVWAKEHGAKNHHGGDPNEWPEDLRVREYPRAAQ